MVAEATPHDPYNPFDVEALRASPDAETFDVEKILTVVPVRKPKRHDFFRIHPGEDFVVDAFVLEHGEDLDQATYWVAPNLREVVGLDNLRKVRLFTCIDKRNNVFLWPAKLPSEYGQGRSWHQSGLRVAEEAKKCWVKMTGNKAISSYELSVAKGDLGEPQWPEHSYQQLIELAFRERLIDSIDHPVIKELNGEI